MEMLIVIAIVAVLISVAVPVLSSQLERSREAVDLANVRAAYAQVSTEALLGNTDITVTVKLKQKQDDWQSRDPITIAGVTHYKAQGDTANWKGIPTAGGECEVYYDSAKAVIVFDWKGKSTPGGTIDWNENLHGILDRTGILPKLNYNQYFEIDSKCPNSTMVPLVEKEMRSDSLLKNGTWAFLGSSTNENSRYLFWTSVDTDAVGAGKQIPVIVSRASGGYYISETITAARSVKEGQSYVGYVAIADHIYSFNTFKDYTTGTKYETLAEAYEAYKKQVENNVKYQDYKDTLPKS